MHYSRKDKITIDDYKVVKILKKEITKKILTCFNNESKTASEIANSISFPKEKIYYHIKNLISNNILFIESSEIVNGIEQKRFLPTAKEYIFGDGKVSINGNDDLIKKNTVSTTTNPQRVKTKKVEPKKNIQIDSEKYFNTIVNKKHNIKKNQRSLLYKNTLLNLNGVKNSISIIETDNRVTILFCSLKKNGFIIKKVQDYTLPFKINEYQITNLPDLIINVFQQLINPKQKKSTYLAIQSDKYKCKMAFLSNNGKSSKLFKKNLMKSLNDIYQIDYKNSFIDYVRYNGSEKNTAVSYTTKTKNIEKDQKVLSQSGLRLRHISTIPKIVHNLFTYYNLDKINQLSLLLYIGRLQTDLVICFGDRIIETYVISKGVNYFLDSITTLTGFKNKNKDPLDDAIHFLSFHGFNAKIPESNTNQRKHYREAIAIIDHNMHGFIQDINNRIFEFSNSFSDKDSSSLIFNKTYIAGPGSHIKNIDTAFENIIKTKVENLSQIVETHIVNDKSGGLLSFENLNKNNLFRKKQNSKSKIENIKLKINKHEKAIKTIQSPESAKYSLARLEIEKNAKIKSIKNANEKLINTSQDFKSLKKVYKKNQNKLHSSLESLDKKLDTYSKNLFEYYKEHEEINKRISELEYESDYQKEKDVKQKISQSNDSGSDIKSVAQKRALLLDNKENFELEIDELETNIINQQELFQKYNMMLSKGNDEIAEFEYLHESIKNIAGIFKRSFLEHLSSVKNIKKEDIHLLQQAGYLITKNTKRIDQIRDSFLSIINSDSNLNKNEFLDGEVAIEVREKLIKILDLIIKAPENLIHLKNQSEVIVKINNDITKIENNKQQLESAISKCKINKREKEQTVLVLKKDIVAQEEDLKEKEKIRLENIEVLNYVQESIEINDELEHHTKLIKEIKPRIKIKKKALANLSSEEKALETLINRNKEKHIIFQNKISNDKNIFLEKQNRILIQDQEKSKNKNEIINQIDFLGEEQKQVINQISNSELYIEKLEKECVLKKEEIEDIKKEFFPIIKNSQDRKDGIVEGFDRRLKQLDQEQASRTSSAIKTKNTTIKKFFKKEEENLKKEVISNKKGLEKIRKEREKISYDRIKIRSELSKNKKIKNPRIAAIKKEIIALEKDLKGGRRIQGRLDALELKKSQWDESLNVEQTNYDSALTVLEKTIKRKKSDEYLSFLVSGLNRIENVSDINETAKKMVNESITIDLNEIQKLDDAFDLFNKRYSAFLLRYKKNSKEFLKKLKPYGGKKKHILNKLEKAKVKMQHEKSIIQKWVDKLDEKNKQYIKIEKEYSVIKEEKTKILKDLQIQIKSIPEKKVKALQQADRDILSIPKEIAKEKTDIVLAKEEALHEFNLELANHTLAMSLNQAEDKILFYFREIEKSKKQINEFDRSLNQLKRSKKSLDSNLESVLRDLKKNKLNIAKLEEAFREKEIIFEEKIGLNKSENSNLNIKLDEIKSQKYEALKDLEKIEKDYSTSHQYQKNYKEKLTSQGKVLNNKTSRKSKTISIQERRRNLYQYEKDLKINIKRMEQTIVEISRFIDTLQNDQSELISEINLIENDNELFDRDFHRYEQLIKDNRNHLNRLSDDHYDTLSGFLKIKNLYPSHKIIINERIANIYSAIELKIKDKEKVEFDLESANRTLKNKRVEMAIVDKEISKIHEQMKNVLEYSLQNNTDDDKQWKWEISNSKMKSYMDVAQLKIRSKELYDEILESEQIVASLKNDQISTKNVLSESERINLKKIKNMEELCTKLELQITREKNELDDISRQVNDLENFPHIHGSKLETLKTELRSFKEQEAEYSLVLRDLDRSISSIKDESERILKNHDNINVNSIASDYTANLGLLMDPDTNLNLLPPTQKKDLKYFRSNQILQKTLLGLVMIFSLGAFANRSEIKPLYEKLPVKKSELSLMNMREEMKSIVFEKNTAVKNFKKYLNNDKQISTAIVQVLKYVSKKIPENFHVTNLVVKNNDFETDIRYSGIKVLITGFFDENFEKSSKEIIKLQKVLNRSGRFKNLTLGPGEKLNKIRTQFTISMEL